MNKETLREDIVDILNRIDDQWVHRSYYGEVADKIMSLLSQSESKEQLSPENENKSNYMSFVNGSATHCNACGKQL